MVLVLQRAMMAMYFHPPQKKAQHDEAGLHYLYSAQRVVSVGYIKIHGSLSLYSSASGASMIRYSTDSYTLSVSTVTLHCLYLQ